MMTENNQCFEKIDIATHDKPFVQKTAVVLIGGFMMLILMAVIYQRTPEQHIIPLLVFVILFLLLTLLLLWIKLQSSGRQVSVIQQAAQEMVKNKVHILTAASHDLRQPLLAQGLFIEELKDLVEEKAPTTDLLHMVNMLDSSNQSMHRLVSSVLEISQLDSCHVQPKFQHFPVSILLEELVLEFMPLVKQKKLNFRFRPIEAVVLSDADLLGRILRNILSNALRYTVHGEIELSCRITYKFLCIDIRDTGIGIAKKKQAEIFKEFYQIEGLKRGSDTGLGLGLSIVERLSKLLRHEVVLSSEPGKGTVFSVKVPYGLPYVHDVARRQLS